MKSRAYKSDRRFKDLADRAMRMVERNGAPAEHFSGLDLKLVERAWYGANLAIHVMHSGALFVMTVNAERFAIVLEMRCNGKGEFDTKVIDEVIRRLEREMVLDDLSET